MSHPDLQGQQWISACLASRVNWYGVPVTLSSRASHPALNDEDLKSISGGATVRKTVHDVKKAGGFAIRNAVLDLGGGFAIRNAVLKLAK